MIATIADEISRPDTRKTPERIERAQIIRVDRWLFRLQLAVEFAGHSPTRRLLTFWTTFATMKKLDPVAGPAVVIDSGLRALCLISGYYRIGADPAHLQRELALAGRQASWSDLILGAKFVGLKARVVRRVSEKQLIATPIPAIACLKEGGFVIFTGRVPNGAFRIVDPIANIERFRTADELLSIIRPEVLLVGRRLWGEGANPNTFGFKWFLPSIWRYRYPLAHVLLASLFIQIFALVAPLFFQVIVDKVLAHKGYSTLYVLVIGILLVGLFDVLLQYQRTYALAHTTNRIDVELGRRLFRHVLCLPLSYFETRAAGQTVARLRELESIRAFLTGQGLFSALDLVFTSVLIAVLFFYSFTLAFIVVAAIPFYIATMLLIGPPLRERIREKFNYGAASQQFMIEAVVGIQTVKSAAVEPLMLAQWEERLAAYVKTSFLATKLGAFGQNGVQYINRIMTACLMLFGAKAVMDGDLTIGGLIAVNMIANQVTQPVLRLAQLGQDFQQVLVSVERLGDILNFPSEPVNLSRTAAPPPRGLIEIRNVTFRYRPMSGDVLKQINLSIAPGDVVGVIGPSGSGKSTLTKLIQRLYVPQEGQILLDGSDLRHADPAWLRGHIGVVLQENILFNRTIHENIAFAAPAMSRQHVIAIARLAGADEFVSRLPEGYDTLVEERGSNLSGGQRQRIAIARALATNPRILIFDEATSALDYESERIIQENLREIVKNRTVIIIAHRLAAVRSCRWIVGIEDGRIVEIGSHDDLLAQSDGLYSRLWKLQNSQALG